MSEMLRDRIDFSRPGRATIYSGKVELGQGIRTAMVQIAAETLGLAVHQVSIVSGDTRRSPNEGFTGGSNSIEAGGAAMHAACAEARRAILEEAARTLGCDPDRLALKAGIIELDGGDSGLDYWQTVSRAALDRPVPKLESWNGLKDATIVGQPIPRIDLPALIFGTPYVHDLELPGMLHGRVVRPPARGARLIALPLEALPELPGVERIWQSGDFVAVACEKEYQAVKAAEAVRKVATWTPGTKLPDGVNVSNWLASQPSLDEVKEMGQRSPVPKNPRRVSATYSKPMIAHASIGPACAVASFAEGRLTVWSHTQGVFPLREALAKVLKLDEAGITVIHQPGAGCYGHNGADDAALDAALLAIQATPRPVRVQWMRDDELAWSPFGSAMSIRMEGELGDSGEISDWSTEVWSGLHSQRPGQGGTPNLLGASLLDRDFPSPDLTKNPGLFAGGVRNSETLYDLPRQRITFHKLPDLPFRLSSLRTLGAFANVVANESFMDELADAAGVDPLAFRLGNLSDLRARRVIETVADMAGWQPGAERGSGRAMGMGFARYKNSAAYAAVVAEVEIDEQVRVSRMYCAVDAGMVINPDGLANQIEGGIIQAVSWTLKECVTFDERAITSRTWEDYPILRFEEVPVLKLEIVVTPGQPPLGVGEAAHGPAAAAIVNAVARALDHRIRDLPITRERIIASLS